MKKLLFLLPLLSSCVFDANPDVINKKRAENSKKEIYIPNDLKNLDFNDSLSQWNYHNMSVTENFVIFWDNKFGNDPSNAPQLEGQDMSVDIKSLERKLEKFYSVYKHDMKFVLPGSKTEKYRMMFMLNYSLEGTAYGGDYDSEIGAMWVTPNRLKDPRLNCVAHELGHSFQSQINSDGTGNSWGGCGFFEMTSQWMLWNVNPLWIKDELYHWEAFTQKTHKAYLHLDNIYHSPYILQYWSEKHGLPVIADLYRAGKIGEDPVMTYKEMFKLTQEQFCDEMFEASCKIVNLDFDLTYDFLREYTNKFESPLKSKDSKGWQTVDVAKTPENYGFNVVPVEIPQKGKSVTVNFKGETKASGYTLKNIDKAGWRYGFVAVTKDDKAIYGESSKDITGKISFKTPDDVEIKHLWLVVMGAPQEHYMIKEDSGDNQWPYSVKFEL